LVHQRSPPQVGTDVRPALLGLLQLRRKSLVVAAQSLGRQVQPKSGSYPVSGKAAGEEKGPMAGAIRSLM
jgi:hypothetical protein